MEITPTIKVKPGMSKAGSQSLRQAVAERPLLLRPAIPRQELLYFELALIASRRLAMSARSN